MTVSVMEQSMSHQEFMNWYELLTEENKADTVGTPISSAGVKAMFTNM